MGYDNKITVSTYDNGRPCVSVETPDGEYLLNDKLVKLN